MNAVDERSGKTQQTDSAENDADVGSSIMLDHDKSVSNGVWRYAHASRAHIVVDAADYFETVQTAMLNAKQRI